MLRLNPRGAMVAQWPPKPKVASSSLTEDGIFIIKLRIKLSFFNKKKQEEEEF